MKTVLRVSEFEARLTPAAIGTGYEAYTWALVNNLRQDPAAFADNVQGLVNGSVGSAFGFSKTDPVVADLKGLINRAVYPANYSASLALMRATPAAGPLAWDGTLENRAEIHNDWMKANGFAHTETTGNRWAIPGFSENDSAPPDAWGYGWPTYSSWGENIAWAVGGLSSSKAAYNAGGLTLAGLSQRAAFLDTVGYLLELNSSSLGHLKNLLGRDAGSSGSLPSFNVFAVDTDLYEAPAQYEAQDGVPEAWVSTQRLGLYRPNGTGGFVTGLAYQDANGNGFYDAGEGQAVTVNIRDAGGNGVTTTTDAFGSFSEYLPNGTYTVTASAGGSILATRTVSLSDSNAWADLAAGGLDRPTVTGPSGTQTVLRPTVTWNPVDGATGYQIRINDLTTGLADLFPGATATGTSWNPPGDLVSGRGYDVVVRALRGSIPGPWSSPDTFSLAKPDASGPTGTVADLRPDFSWTGVAGARYEVRVNDLTTFTPNIFPGAVATGNSWSPPSDLVAGRTYQWKIRAINADGLGAWTPLTQFSVARAVPTGPATGVNAHRPTFTWAPVAGATKYVVVVNDVSAGLAGVLRGTVTGSSWTPPTDLVSGRTYSWQVRTVNADGLGWWSKYSTFTVGRAVAIGPGGPLTGTRPTFTWAGLNGSSRYQVRVDDLTTGQTDVLRAQVVSSQSWTPGTSLLSGHSYRWSVRSIVSGGPGIWYGWWSTPKDFRLL